MAATIALAGMVVAAAGQMLNENGEGEEAIIGGWGGWVGVPQTIQCRVD